jgi:hypothetical protein
MANLKVNNADGSAKYLKASGAGTDLDPHIPEQKVNQGDAGSTAWLVETEVQGDYDTSGGTQNLSMIGLALPASGGPVPGGTATNPLRVDPTGTTTQPVAGDVAHDAADSGNPVKVGAVARTTNPTAVADADRVNLRANKLGDLIVLKNAPRELKVRNTVSIAGTGETTILAAGAASVYHDLTHLTITNGSASATVVTLRDATGGSAVDKYSIAANGGITINFSDPATQATAANNWTLQSSVACNLEVNVKGFKTL